MKYFIAIVISAFLSGCTIMQPAIVEYRIKPVIVELNSDAHSCEKLNIKVIQAFSSSSLMSSKMKYTQDAFSEYQFNQSEWSESPNKAVTSEILNSITSSKLFKSVQSYKSRSKSDFILESTIEEFAQHFTDDSSYGRVVITMTLINTKTDEVIDTRQFTKSVEAKSRNAQAGVVALNAALSDVLSQSNLWLAKVCK